MRRKKQSCRGFVLIKKLGCVFGPKKTYPEVSSSTRQLRQRKAKFFFCLCVCDGVGWIVLLFFCFITKRKNQEKEKKQVRRNRHDDRRPSEPQGETDRDANTMLLLCTAIRTSV